MTTETARVIVRERGREPYEIAVDRAYLFEVMAAIEAEFPNVTGWTLSE